MKKFIILICLLFISSYSYGEKCLTDEQAKRVNDRLEKDKKIIQWQSKRWNDLIETDPKIKFENKEDSIIIQTIEFPIENDNPLVYELKLEILKKQQEMRLIPLTLSLCAMIEPLAPSMIDAKFGIQLLNFAPLKIPYIEQMGVHAMIGFQSIGVSLSYMLSKKFQNTRIHLYSGFTYQLKQSYGVGISLNF